MYSSSVFTVSHDISVAGVVEEHVVELLHGLHLGPLALLDQLLVDLVVVDEEVVEAFVPVGNVPSNQTSGFHNSQQLSECLCVSSFKLWRSGYRERKMTEGLGLKITDKDQGSIPDICCGHFGLCPYKEICQV